MSPKLPYRREIELEVSALDMERCRELLIKLAEIRNAPNVEARTEYAYWKGYLASYCAQNAIPDEALARIWDSDFGVTPPADDNTTEPADTRLPALQKMTAAELERGVEKFTEDGPTASERENPHHTGAPGDIT